MKILCICPIGVGNYLMFYPACAALKKQRPDWSLHLLGLRCGILDFAEGDSLWDGIHVFDPTKIKTVFKKVEIVRALRRSRFDISLNFFPENRREYNLLPYLAGIPGRIAFRYHKESPDKLAFLRTDAVAVDEMLHDARQNISLLGKLVDVDPHREPLSFPALYAEQEKTWADEYLSSLDGKRYIGIHAGSSAEHGMDAKRWEPEKFAELSDKICEKLTAQVLLFGGPDETPIKQTIVDCMKRPAHIVEPVSLRRTAALFSRCAVAVCNDSGLMHLSACVGTPTVGIFGPTDERRNGPMGEHTLVVRHHMDGFPLWTAANVGSRAVPEGIDPRESLKRLGVTEAWEVIEPWLERIRHRKR